MKLSIIIVNYNVCHYLEQCLDSILKSNPAPEMEIWVVDNHSKDDSVETIRKEFPEVKLVALAHNLGFARANNVAIRQSAGEYVLLLNPDTVLAEDTLSKVLAFMDSHPKAGGCGVRMSHTDGSDAKESRRGIPTPMTSFYKMSGLCARFPNHPRFGHYYMSNLPWDKPGQIEVISGAFCMLRKSALDKAGLLDEDFFMYGEDIDLSYRLIKAGYECWYVPCRILHYKGESTVKSSFRYVHVFYQAMLIFFRKHYGGMSVLLRLPIKLAILAMASGAFISMQAHRIKLSLGFTDRPQRPVRYLFIGSDRSMNDMKRIARENGLEATFLKAEGAVLDHGHLDQHFSADKYVVVYDMGVFDYAHVLDFFSRKPQPNVLVGFYHPLRSMVITPVSYLK